VFCHKAIRVKNFRYGSKKEFKIYLCGILRRADLITEEFLELKSRSFKARLAEFYD
jgi:hypothetical protein